MIIFPRSLSSFYDPFPYLAKIGPKCARLFFPFKLDEQKQKLRYSLHVRILKSVFRFLIKFHSISTEKILCILPKTRPISHKARETSDTNAQQEHCVRHKFNLFYALATKQMFGQTKLDFTRKLIDFNASSKLQSTRHRANKPEKKQPRRQWKTIYQFKIY